MKLIRKVNDIKTIMTILFILTIFFTNNVLYADANRTQGQSVYLSLYPKIERAGKRVPTFLSTILTIRNTDLRHPITVNSIDYYDSSGALKRHVLNKPMIINPISSTSMRFEEKELSTERGMTGCFIIVWKSSKRVSEPIIEGILGTTGTGWVKTLVFYGQAIEDDSR